MSPASEALLFERIAATGRERPILVEVPHAGTFVPADLPGALTATEEDRLRDADTFVDRLWRDAPAQGATTLVACVSRYVVDLNRTPDDYDGRAVVGGPASPPQPRGVIWRLSGAGRAVLASPLSRDEYDQRIERYFRPYHDALERELRRLGAQHGRVVLLSAHSMPSRARGACARRADIVPGTRGRSTAHPALIDAVEQHFRAAGLSVRHDEPYRGGATTQRWGRPSAGVHAIQIEVNRGLYLDEARLAPIPDQVAWLSTLCASLVTRLAGAIERISG